MKAWLVAALVAVAGTQAQAQRAAEPVVVEVIGTGAVEVRATTQRFVVTYSGRGATTAAAEAARSRKESEVLRLLAAEGVPASAIMPLTPAELARASIGSLVDSMGTSDAAADAAPNEEAKGGRAVQVATVVQVNSITAKLKAIGVDAGAPTASFDNIAGARRDARLAALRDARMAADRYAAALGMRVGGVRRVSETGSGAVLPGLQEKLGTLIATGGPALMQQMMQPPKESVKVEESVVAEYALLP